MSENSAIYCGNVVHQRFKPKKHALRYKVFSLLVDLDELPDLGQRLKLFAHNRFGIFSVQDKDHGLGEKGRLKHWVAERLVEAGIAADDLSVTMLCYPRIFGYVFNPLTVYFCRNGEGALKAVLYEVCNTFYERHTYIIPVESGADQAPAMLTHSADKRMYVSPFVPMECTYHFRIQPPESKVLIAIHETDAEGPLLFASFAGQKQAMSDANLLKALLRYPLMTLKVMVAIHWEAMKLWRKGVPIYSHAKADKKIVSSVVHQAKS